MARRDRFTFAAILCCADRQFGAQVRLHHKKLQNPQPSEATGLCLMARRLLR